jgi:hypothetical protein
VDTGPARRVVAVRDDQHRLLLVPPTRRHRHRFDHRVVHCRSTVRRNPSQRARQRTPIGGPVLQQHGIVAEPVDENLVALIEQVVEEPVERGARGIHFLARHAPAGVEHDAQADRHPFRAEVRHALRLFVFVDDEVFLPQVGHEAAAAVGDRRGDVDQLDATLEPEPLGALRLRALRLLAGKRCHAGEHREEQGETALHCLLRSTWGTTRSSLRKLTR